MEESELKKGRRVFISSTIATRNTHTTSSIMKGMLNKSYKIQYNQLTPYGLAAVINGYYWHPKDLSLYEPPVMKKPKIQHFDIKELVI